VGRGPEAKLVQDPLTKYLRDNQILHKKKDTGKWTTSAGWPDLEIYPGNGGVFFIECKAPGKKADPLQQHVHSQLRTRGYLVYVVDNKHMRGMLSSTSTATWSRI
jgi:hypothetical protein